VLLVASGAAYQGANRDLTRLVCDGRSNQEIAG